MKLDLRTPSIVISGAWNPMIFQAGWVAHHLFGYPLGEQVTGISLTASALGDQPIMFFDGAGIRATGPRLEIYLNDITDDVKAKAEGLVTKLLEVLNHTPVHACGMNYRFVDELNAKTKRVFENVEPLSKQLPIAAMEIKTSARDKSDEVVTVKRTLIEAENLVSIDFNFHIDNFNLDIASKIFPGAFDKFRKRAINLLKQLYDLEAEGLLCYEELQSN